VSGGDIGARQGTLLIMVGGQDQVFERCRPIFERLGKTIIRIGPAGAGQVAKACNQVILGATIAGVAEALVYAARAGADPAVIRQALLGGFAQSKVLEVHGQRMLEGVFKPGFYLRLHEKDLHIATEEGRTVGAALPITALVEQLMTALITQGMGELDDSVLVRAYEKFAGHSLSRADTI
jgi:2-hydroxy-3-oxopropionate reductase